MTAETVPTFNDVGSRLERGDVILGTMLTEVRNPSIAAVLAACDLDFFILDMEHGSYSWETMQDIVGMANPRGLASIVRIPEVRRETILKPLDAGASGVMVPVVERPEQVTSVLEHAKYRPVGARGAALGRAQTEYRSVDAPRYMARANAEILVIVQIESVAGVEAVDELAGIEGVDALFVGPMDLSVDLGVPGDVNNARVRTAVDRVLAAGLEHGVPTGIHTFDLDTARVMIEEGVQIISYSNDVKSIMTHMTQGVSALRESRGDATRNRQ